MPLRRVGSAIGFETMEAQSAHSGPDFQSIAAENAPSDDDGEGQQFLDARLADQEGTLMSRAVALDLSPAALG